jgi:L-aminopeptidase/D-esterase-like protein
VSLRAAGLALALGALLTSALGAQAPRPRARELGIPIGGTPGPLDAITDVAGVEVGHRTLVRGSGPLVVGQGPVRTGVTVVLPRGRANQDPVFAAWFTLNGNGEMTGTTWLRESGFLEGPVAITNTHSVGVVRDAVIRWELGQRVVLQPWWLPVVAETFDGRLNDINGFHVTTQDALLALDSARGGPVREGAVGGGTGMTCHGFKGGIGTASRVLPAAEGGYTVGVLVQCNYGARRDLRIAGVPVGEEIADLMPCVRRPSSHPEYARIPACAGAAGAPPRDDAEQGSIIVVVATDAPLLPHQLDRLVKRVASGLGRQGGFGGNSSGDIFVAFSTANARSWTSDSVATVRMLDNERLTPLFRATAQATEGAITNALLQAETMTGAEEFTVFALPIDRLRAVMARYGRPLASPR